MRKVVVFIGAVLGLIANRRALIKWVTHIPIGVTKMNWDDEIKPESLDSK
ncbi:hypothetical protein [Shimazuella kribbensis]|nr:hypothetical protein [Shimazuella kribbensis]